MGKVINVGNSYDYVSRKLGKAKIKMCENLCESVHKNTKDIFPNVTYDTEFKSTQSLVFDSWELKAWQDYLAYYLKEAFRKTDKDIPETQDIKTITDISYKKKLTDFHERLVKKGYDYNKLNGIKFLIDRFNIYLNKYNSLGGKFHLEVKWQFEDFLKIGHYGEYDKRSCFGKLGNRFHNKLNLACVSDSFIIEVSKQDTSGNFSSCGRCFGFVKDNVITITNKYCDNTVFGTVTFNKLLCEFFATLGYKETDRVTLHSRFIYFNGDHISFCKIKNKTKIEQITLDNLPFVYNPLLPPPAQI